MSQKKCWGSVVLCYVFSLIIYLYMETETSKICSRCKDEKAVEEFYLKDSATGKRQAHCKECNKTAGYSRKAYLKDSSKAKALSKARNQKLLEENRKQLLIYFKEHPCVVCGEKDLRCLEFDHLDTTTKNFGIAQKLDKYNWKKLSAEIEKCQVLCSNCHQKRTAAQFSWWKNCF